MFWPCLISTAEAGLFESQSIFIGFCWVCSFCLYEDVCLLCLVLIAQTCSASQNLCLLLGCMMLLICTPALSSPMCPHRDGFWRLGRGFTGRIRAARCIAKQQRCGHLKETALWWLSLCKALRSAPRALCHTSCLLFLYPCVARIFVSGMEMILFPGRNRS